MKAVSLKMGVVALVAITLVSFIPFVGSFVIAPIVALGVGAGAGWWASKVAGTGTAEGGAKAGALAGVGALLGSILGLTILLLILGNDPALQEAIRNSEPHPEARLPYEWMALLAALGGVGGGFLADLFDLVLALVGGLFAGLVYGQNHKVAA